MTKRNLVRQVAFLILAHSACLLAPAASSEPSQRAETRPTATAPTPFFRITVVDAQTTRGIPCVRVTTNNKVEYWTDSAGVVAFCEPDMMNKNVVFHVETPGYALPPTGPRPGSSPESHSLTLRAIPGGAAVVPMRRENVAQRLYRVTGADIYRDSVLLGDKVPPVRDAAESLVLGQDSVDTIIYKSKILWLWGDTELSDQDMQNTRVTCATSELPGKGGLDPEVGVALTYFRKDGNIKPMVNDPHWIIWLRGLRFAKDESGKERLFADYAKVRGFIDIFEVGLAIYDDKKEHFDLVYAYPNDAAIKPNDLGQVFRYTDNGVEYFYYGSRWPNIRSRTDAASLKNVAGFEAFTCLKKGARFAPSPDKLDRDKAGRLRWGWKKNTSPVGADELSSLLQNGLISPQEQWYLLRDVNTTETLTPHHGCVRWNPYRNRWISIRSQAGGSTFLGEIWYFEADTPVGPWVYGQKIVTHALKDYPYSFYNPTQHPEFDKDGGRVIFFEGTYTQWFSGCPSSTPRYEYNQVMYKLELDDPRLFLPVPVYEVGGAIPSYRTKTDIADEKTPREIAFFAPDRPREGTVPVFEKKGPGKNILVLTTEPGAGATPAEPIRFYAVSPSAEIPSSSSLALTVPLYEFVDTKSGARTYSTKESLGRSGLTRTASPICRVWPNPILFNPYDVK